MRCRNSSVHPLATRFRAFVDDPSFVCVGAKASLARGRMRVMMAKDLLSSYDDPYIYSGLCEIVRDYRANREMFQSLAVIFEQPTHIGEESFERALWERAQSLSDKDASNGQAYDRRVSIQPDNPHFSLSFAEEGFFIVGLHPGASREARRFEQPTLVFNLHDQFERLRENGDYEKMRAVILERDKKLTGSVNPMLARHGEKSEACQYSGRQVGTNWKCPFDPMERSSHEPKANSTEVRRGLHSRSR